MKIIVSILFVNFWLVTFCQTDTVFFKTGNENTITKYEIQKASDTAGPWETLLPTISKGKKNYSYTFKRENVFWRIKATGKQTFVTGPMVMILPQNRVEIVSPVKTSTYLTWTTKGETNVDYFYIDKTLDSKKYSKTTTVSAKGDRKYSYKYSKTILKYKYRLTVFFNDGTKKDPINFK